MKVRFRPSGGMVGDESGKIVCMFITGNICTKEVKLGYLAHIAKCPIAFDKQRLEFPALPAGETSEIILSSTNRSGKEYEVEIVQPYFKVAGF